MLGVCRRYVKNDEEAEDVMVEGFYKVLTKIDMYSGEGSFEGWVRRIMVNESLMHLRKANHFRYTEEVTPTLNISENPTVVNELAASEIIGLLDELPTGYRTVFNLYVVEGYKHREIAEELWNKHQYFQITADIGKKRMEELVGKRLGITSNG